jgi:hypothetical protein
MQGDGSMDESTHRSKTLTDVFEAQQTKLSYNTYIQLPTLDVSSRIRTLSSTKAPALKGTRVHQGLRREALAYR